MNKKEINYKLYNGNKNKNVYFCFCLVLIFLILGLLAFLLKYFYFSDTIIYIYSAMEQNITKTEIGVYDEYIQLSEHKITNNINNITEILDNTYISLSNTGSGLFTGATIDQLYHRPCTLEETQKYVDFVIASLIKNDPLIFSDFNSNPELMGQTLTEFFTNILPIMKEGAYPHSSGAYNHNACCSIKGLYVDPLFIKESPYWNSSYHFTHALDSNLHSGYIHFYFLWDNRILPLFPHCPDSHQLVIDLSKCGCNNFQNSPNYKLYHSFFLSESIFLNNNWSLKQIDQISYLINDINIITNPNFYKDILWDRDSYIRYNQSIEICKRIFKALNY